MMICKIITCFVFAEPNVLFKTTEQTSMKEYIEQGGSIPFIGDHYNTDRNKIAGTVQKQSMAIAAVPCSLLLELKYHLNEPQI